MAFYLKYRPQSLTQLDITKVREQLMAILTGKQTPHAFLFVGPKGTGKTSSARILAKVVNCLKPDKNGLACNRCDACQLIDGGNTMDLIEIDAASNRGIDDIRELREKVKLVPSKLKFKIYIIDEAHMLTNEAFNAFLKTLEEPPAHVKFVLCTTEGHKLPATIISRLTKVEFSKASIKELVTALKKVVKGESLTIEQADLEKIAKSSDGSFRDAVKILEMLSAGSKKISNKMVAELLSQGGDEQGLDDWLIAIFKGEKSKAMEWLQVAVNQGVDMRSLSLRAVERLREVLLQRYEIIPGNDLKEINNLPDLIRLVDVLHLACREVKTAVIDSLPLELCIVNWTTSSVKSMPQPQPTGSDPVGSSPSFGKLNMKKLQIQWPDFLKALRPHNHSLEALLRSAQPQGFEGNFLVINVFYQFHKDRLEDDRYHKLVEKVLSDQLGQAIRVKFLLGEKSDNLSSEVDDDIIKTAEKIFGSDLRG
jgi:DNA polymerase-3 subunit gamma/tau